MQDQEFSVVDRDFDNPTQAELDRFYGEEMHEHTPGCNVNTCEVMAAQAAKTKAKYEASGKVSMEKAINKLKERFNSR